MVVNNGICPAFLALEIQNCLRSLLLYHGLLVSRRVHSNVWFYADAPADDAFYAFHLSGDHII